MEPRNRQRIDGNQHFLIENLDIFTLVNKFLEKGIVNRDDYDRIQAETTDRSKTETFLRIFVKKPPKTYDKFCSLLEETDMGHIKQKLDEYPIDEAALQRQQQNVDEKIREYLRKNYKEKEGELVSFPELVDNLQDDFELKSEALPCRDQIIRIIENNFRSVKRKIKKKKIHKLVNLKRLISADDVEEEIVEDTRSAYSDDGNPPKMLPPGNQKRTVKTLNRKLIKDTTKEELIDLLKPKLLQHSMEKNTIIKTLDAEKVSGMVFEHLDPNDVKELFPTLTFGDRKLILLIRDELLAEENGGTRKQSESTSLPLQHQEYEEIEKDSKLHFRETFRKFHSTDKKTYRKNAVVSTTNTRISNLLTPIHKFLFLFDKSKYSASEWVAEETIKFAAACMNERTNGTIHFGICGEKTEKYEEGEIIGINVDKGDCTETLSRMIKQTFFEDQHEVAFKCIHPVQFIDVYEQDSRNQALHIIEVDVEPASEQIEDDAFYVKAAGRIGRNWGKSSMYLFKFENDTSNSICLSEKDVRQFMKNKSNLSEQRRRIERAPVETKMKEDLRTKFLNLFTGGEETLSHDLYPILFLSAIDSSMTEDYFDEKFRFLVDIDANAIFDFDASSDRNGMFHFFENKQKQVVKVFTTENFDRNSEENSNKKERYNSMLDDLRFSSVKPWIFCNGYESMNKVPMKTLDWKQKRSEGFKDALRFFQDEIPVGRAFVIFLLFSKQYEILLEAADEVLVKFKDQWIIIAPNEEISHSFMDELVKRKMTDEKILSNRAIIGMPWQHVNKMIIDVVMPLKTNQCEIITSSGAFCILREKTKNELCDISVLSSKECDDSAILSDPDKREKLRRNVEENFFIGKEVTWWNLWFQQDHVLQRSQHKKLMKMVRHALDGNGMEEDSKVGVVNLFHQPGSGGTTSAKQVLWDLKTEYRCCYIKQLSEDTCDQITALRIFEDPETPKPPLVLIDNGDEEKIQNLYSRLEDKALIASRSNPLKVFCVLLLCTRRVNLPKQINNRSISLKHELDEKELDWFHRKNKALETHFGNSTGGCDPRLLISFNILKENFNKDYIKNAVKEFVDGVESSNEQRLLKYLSLLNMYDPDFKPVPMSAFDPLMQNMYRKGKNKLVLTFGLIPSKRQCWENNISSSLQILLNRTSRAGMGGQLRALSIINSLFAREILSYLKKKLEQSTGEIMLELLNSDLFQVNNQSQSLLLGKVKEIMKKREVQDSGKKDKFSRIVTDVLEIEGADKASSILIKTFEISDDPMVAQQLARLYIHFQNWDKAIYYAKKATELKPKNSYVWDTFAQVYKSQLLEKYKECLETEDAMQNETIDECIQICFEGMQKFRKEQELTSLERTECPNDAAYFGELKIIIVLLDLIVLLPSLSTEQFHKFLVDPHYTPVGLEFLDVDRRQKLKDLHSSTEQIMRTLEDKKTQVKEDFISDIIQSKQSLNLNELAKIKENLDQYFGEDTDIIPETLKGEDKILFIRRRVKKQGGRTLTSILDTAKYEGGSEKLQGMLILLEQAVKSEFCSAFDLMTIIGVSLVLNIQVKKQCSYQNFKDWSRTLYNLTSKSKDQVFLESFLYFVMFHWPMGLPQSDACPTSDIVDAIKKWKIAFRNKHPRQDGRPVQRKDKTYFFLGKGTEMDSIVHYDQLLDEKKGRGVIGDGVWRQPYVLSKLKRLTGILIAEGLEIEIQIETKGGNKTVVTIPTSMPIGQKFLWQKRVYFVLGFGWGGPRAYDISQEDITNENLKNEVQNLGTNLRFQRGHSEMEKVKTHDDLKRTLGKIDREIEDIKARKKSGRPHKEDKKRLEQHVVMREKLIQERDQFLRD
ncbi:hypothetical protein KUTeg_018915 [Tegillarca granosa]|uniref:CARD domain-containing protein n=1 Tax=Tegillarca granosa TaxID=220873 RepID=A0ABQ9ED55_TEGGR|nr:hypothetical protein KUTeg_018915 [Tegillarca granosa]